MHPPASPKPMEAAAVACRGGLLARARPGRRARARVWEHGVGVGSAPSAARRRLLVASLGVGEPLPAHTTAEGAVALEVDADTDSAEILPPPDVPAARTVRVKFVLKRQCAFGQQFLVVGNDPALGLWDPAKATALDWSEGHVWTVKTELPANKLIEFKFLLRDASGHVRWQHGANRILRTNDTPNTLVVHEDWDHAKNQKVTEEEVLSIRAEDVNFLDDFAASNGAMVADKLQTEETLETNKSPVVADASLHGETMGADEANQHQLILGKDQKILDELRGEESMVPQNGNPFADDNAGRNDDDTTLSQEVAALPANKSNSIFENDLTWARKALQQLLRILGFQIGTTRT